MEKKIKTEHPSVFCKEKLKYLNAPKKRVNKNDELTQLKAENERLKETLRKILMESGGTSPYAGFHDVYQLAKESLTHKER
jgi:hypothetical protein